MSDQAGEITAEELRRRGRRRLWISLAMPLAGLLLAEGLVRIAGPPVVPMPEIEGNLFVEVHDPILRYINLVNGNKTIRYDDGRGRFWNVNMRSNSQRFRGPEVAQSKPEGVLRVACLGDSHTW